MSLSTKEPTVLLQAVVTLVLLLLITTHCRLSQYLSVLQAQEVDFYTFLTLNDEDLKELGITSFGAKKKLVTAIQGQFFCSKAK